MISTDAMNRIISEVDGVVGLVVRDLRSSEELAINGHIRFRAASIIKLPIFWSYFIQCQHGELDPDESVDITPDSVAGGFGILRILKLPVRMRLRDLAALMIVVSDNTATNILIDRLGMDRVNADMATLGLTETFLQRRMCDYENPQDNFSSPIDVANLLEAFWTAPSLTAESRAEAFAILHGQQCRNKLRAAIPEALPFAHKTGDLPGVEHDTGILFVDDRPIIVVVMMQDLTSNTDAVASYHQIGKLISRHFDCSE